MSYNSNLNSDVVKTALDGVWDQTFDGGSHPGNATAETAAIFNQDTVSNSAVILDLFSGVGEYKSRSEEQNVALANPRITNQKTFSVSEFANSVDIPKVFFDDQMHSSYEKMVKSMALRARTTRDKNAFAPFRNNSTTSDGVALISDSHTAIAGHTVDNRVNAVLSETALNTAIVLLRDMKSQDGEIDGQMARVLLVPTALYKSACEISQSELRSGTANNDMNVYLTKYGITVMTSPYLGAGVTGGSDANWYLLGDNHSMTRWVRQGVQTDLVPYEVSRNNVYTYKASFREVVGAMNYEGIVGYVG